MSALKDVQSERDSRKIPIDRVGVSDLSYPISVLDRERKVQHTVAKINMAVDLPHHFRGTHMSRFVEVVSRHNVELGLHSLESILDDMIRTFKCERSHFEIEFPYFLNKPAPVSGMVSPMEYFCKVYADKSGRMDLTIEVRVPVNNLCPCSKEISDNGAHNQRGIITIRVRSSKLVWFEELIAVAEDSCSAPLYTLLKRDDEKFVTERAYAEPRFVEDSAREVALRLDRDDRIDSYRVEVKNFESIHNHNAYACIERVKK